MPRAVEQKHSRVCVRSPERCIKGAAFLICQVGALVEAAKQGERPPPEAIARQVRRAKCVAQRVDEQASTVTHSLNPAPTPPPRRPHGLPSPIPP